MHRRTHLKTCVAALATVSAWRETVASTKAKGWSGVIRLASCWQRADVARDRGHGHEVGVLEVNFDERRVRVVASHAVPTRGHGLWPMPDGGFVASAFRPGRWLVRVARDGTVDQRQEQASKGSTLNGHVLASADARWLYASETALSGSQTSAANIHQGVIGVYDADTLAKVDEWQSRGIEPHHVVLGPRPEDDREADGQAGHAPASNSCLWVAHGGIQRDVTGQKRRLDAMASSLVCLSATTGERLGAWRLSDSKLSLRHVALGTTLGHPTLGIAVQAEHDDDALRRSAPTLALWDHGTLSTPTHSSYAQGYAGDITSMDEGFVLSNSMAGAAWLWSPKDKDRLHPLATVQQSGATTVVPIDGHDAPALALSAGAGLAFWHREIGALLLPWPDRLSMDNHWVLLAQ